VRLRIPSRAVRRDRRRLQEVRLRLRHPDGPKPPQPIAKTGASLLAHVIVGKIADHVPLHRQGRIFSWLGVDIADQTMGGWMPGSFW